MTSRPRTLDQWARFREINPQLEGESWSEYFSRLAQLANAKEDGPSPGPSLPYREPGGDDE